MVTGGSEANFGVIVSKNEVPAWIWVADGFRAKLKWVLATERPEGLELSEEVEWVTSLGQVASSTQLVVFESKGPTPTHPVWAVDGLKVVVWMVTSESQARRYRPPGDNKWRVEERWVGHDKLGGVTNHTAKFRIATRLVDHSVRWAPILGLEATLSQVLDCTAEGKTAKGPTVAKPSSKSEQLNVTELDAHFLVPCDKSRTGWVKRRLTSKEVGKAFDIPAHVVRDLKPTTLERLFDGGIVAPFKSRFYLAECIRPLLEQQPPLIQKRASVEDVGEGQPLCKKVRRDLLDLMVAPSGEGQQAADQGVMRSKEGAKADGASVPKFFWDERLNLNTDRNGPPISKDRIQRTLDFVRAKLHQIWCRRVARSFWRYVVEEKARCRRTGEEFDA